MTDQNISWERYTRVLLYSHLQIARI